MKIKGIDTQTSIRPKLIETITQRDAFPVVTIGLCFIAIEIFVSVFMLYNSYQSNAFDLGLFSQSIKYTLEGKILYNNIDGLSQLAYHFSPVLLLLVPIYWLFPHPQTLLVCQALLFGLSGCLVYILCRVNHLNHKTGMFVESLFFINPLLWGVILFDFHEVAFAVPAFLILFIGIQTRRWWLTIIGLIIALTTKEDVIIVTAIFGATMAVYYYWKERRIVRIYPVITIVAIITYGIAVAVSAIASQGEFPRILTYSTVRFAYLELPANEALKGALTTLFSLNSSFLLFAYLAPLLFLPLVALEWSLPALIVLLENMLSTCPSQHSLLLQSQTPAVPFLFMAFIIAIPRVKNRLEIQSFMAKMGKRVYIYLIIILVIVSALYISTGRITLAKFPGPHEHDVDKILSLIPDGATVTANNSIFPHIYDRTDTYLPYWKDPYTPIDDGDWGFPDRDTEYVVMDSMYTQAYGGGGLWEDLFKKDLNMKYKLIADIDGAKLYKLRQPALTSSK